MTKFQPNPNLSVIIKRASEHALVATLVLTSEGLKTKLQPPPQRTGRIYKRGSRMHQASAAGEAPNVDTGRLRLSWGVRGLSAETSDGAVERISVGRSFGFRLSSLLHYAAIDRGYGNVAPRPYIQPTLVAIRNHAEQVAAWAFSKALKEGSA